MELHSMCTYSACVYMVSGHFGSANLSPGEGGPDLTLPPLRPRSNDEPRACSGTFMRDLQRNMQGSDFIRLPATYYARIAQKSWEQWPLALKDKRNGIKDETQGG